MIHEMVVDDALFKALTRTKKGHRQLSSFTFEATEEDEIYLSGDLVIIMPHAQGHLFARVDRASMNEAKRAQVVNCIPVHLGAPS